MDHILAKSETANWNEQPLAESVNTSRCALHSSVSAADSFVKVDTFLELPLIISFDSVHKHSSMLQQSICAGFELFAVIAGDIGSANFDTRPSAVLLSRFNSNQVSSMTCSVI